MPGQEFFPCRAPGLFPVSRGNIPGWICQGCSEPGAELAAHKKSPRFWCVTDAWGEFQGIPDKTSNNGWDPAVPGPPTVTGAANERMCEELALSQGRALLLSRFGCEFLDLGAFLLSFEAGQRVGEVSCSLWMPWLPKPWCSMMGKTREGRNFVSQGLDWSVRSWWLLYSSRNSLCWGLLVLLMLWDLGILPAGPHVKTVT